MKVGRDLLALCCLQIDFYFPELIEKKTLRCLDFSTFVEFLSKKTGRKSRELKESSYNDNTHKVSDSRIIIYIQPTQQKKT